jgi:hypothetical protein
MIFGKYDGHEGVLVLATVAGRLIFKYIKTAVDITGLGVEGGGHRLLPLLLELVRVVLYEWEGQCVVYVCADV